MVLYKLVHESTGSILHIGTKAECQMIFGAFVTYGIPERKLVIEEAK